MRRFSNRWHGWRQPVGQSQCKDSLCPWWLMQKPSTLVYIVCMWMCRCFLSLSLSLCCTVCICFRCADHPVTSWNESWHGHAEDYNGCPKGTANLHKPGKTSTVDFFEDTNAVERWNGIVIFFNMLFEQLNIGCPFGAPKSNDLLCRYVLLCFLHIFPHEIAIWADVQKVMASWMASEDQGPIPSPGVHQRRWDMLGLISGLSKRSDTEFLGSVKVC